ncbi:hypothetical protein NE237_000878 [Protea cynaroides]|uniref:Uncharacterized protein n=1 Tax=Protea cynaroides TaxID=273540 RepID=A0A9Q0KS15_9MAGN|nr:hypothetical protein NE237_000878 [Protea cynaroides]
MADFCAPEVPYICCQVIPSKCLHVERLERIMATSSLMKTKNWMGCTYFCVFTPYFDALKGTTLVCIFTIHLSGLISSGFIFTMMLLKVGYGLLAKKKKRNLDSLMHLVD